MSVWAAPRVCKILEVWRILGSGDIISGPPNFDMLLLSALISCHAKLSNDRGTSVSWGSSNPTHMVRLSDVSYRVMGFR